MDQIKDDLKNVQLTDDIFKDVKFRVTGEVDDKIIDLLKCGGAEHMNYFSDYVTHLIVGTEPEENDITDAIEVYEIPALLPKWVHVCAALKKLVNTKPFQYNPNKLFSNLVFCLAKPDKDLETLWSLITFNGGNLQLNLNNKCTHLITVETGSRKYLRAADFPDKITIVTPDWIMECIKKGSLADANLFHPKLIIWPKSVKHESTTAITGFEPDVPEEKEVKEESEVADSTQALLEKLKQRMPWNQPPVTTGETVAPPNVVAPGFVNKSPVVQRTMPQSPVIQQQQQQPQQQQQQSPTISRSVVHHTPPTSFVQQLQSPPQQQQQQINAAMNIAARTMNPQQVQVQGPRPNMQLRGALPNQIQQQLLQQRLNQQNVMQRPAGQMVLQQQLLQQQLSQGQRQLLQGQPIQNQHQLAQLQQLKQQMQQQQQQQQNHLVQQQLMQQQQLQQQQQQQQSMLLQQQQPPQLMQQHQQFVSQGQQFIQGQSNFVQQQNLSQQLQQKNLGQQLNQQQLVQQQQQQQQPLEQQQPPQQQVIRTQFNQQIIINQSPRQQHFFQQQQQQQQGGPRPAQWSANQQMRQYIHLDANTHNQLQKLPPEQRTAFFLKLQKDKLKQQQRGGSHILIRGAVPAGLNHQQQVQWLQQQAKQQGIALPPNLQQQTITPGTLTPQQPTQPALSPIQQPPPPFVPAPADPNQQQQLRQYRLQQLQLQREQAQKLAQQQQQQQPTVRPMVQQSADSTTAPIQPLPEAAGHHPLVVNAKTKTALANMLSIRLQSGGTSIGQEPEPSAAGTLRLMTAQHNAALNSNNRPQELLGLQQRGRVISGPNGEIIRPPGPIPTPTTPQSEPPKLQFGPRPAVPIQHNRVGPFYGHNPNLKLPSNLFLLGCIFVVVEIERYLDEAIPSWQEKIEKHGGEVEKHYCSRVTHVLCETQKHGIVMQAIRDCKRCVTIYWLSDIMKRRQVLPPWTALHLPIIYLDTTPASKHLIGISGFTASERTRVKHMITYTGATVTSYFSKHNTLLVVAKAEGPKFNYAKKWAIPVVNVQWLTDVMLGNFTAMSQMEHVLYQQFPTPPNFSFDPKLVPNLMHAWKMPINISQESYERVKRCASPVSLPKKPKQPKTEQTDENDNIDDQQKFNCTHKILLSRVEDIDGTKSVIKQLGGCVVTNHQEATHLVMPELTRTNKLLFCIPLGVSILPEQWLKDSQTNNQFTNEFNYRFDVKQFNRQYQCDFNQTMSMKDRNKLFEGKTFWVSPSCFPNKKVLEELLRLSGGHVETVRRTAAQIEATNTTSPFTYFIIVHENDLHLVADLLKTKKDKITKTICSAELVYSSILRQQIDPDKYSVKIA